MPANDAFLSPRHHHLLSKELGYKLYAAAMSAADKPDDAALGATVALALADVVEHAGRPMSGPPSEAGGVVFGLPSAFVPLADAA